MHTRASSFEESTIIVLRFFSIVSKIGLCAILLRKVHRGTALMASVAARASRVCIAQHKNTSSNALDGRRANVQHGSLTYRGEAKDKKGEYTDRRRPTDTRDERSQSSSVALSRATIKRLNVRVIRVTLIRVISVRGTRSDSDENGVRRHGLREISAVPLQSDIRGEYRVARLTVHARQSSSITAHRRGARHKGRATSGTLSLLLRLLLRTFAASSRFVPSERMHYTSIKLLELYPRVPASPNMLFVPTVVR